MAECEMHLAPIAKSSKQTSL